MQSGSVWSFLGTQKFRSFPCAVVRLPKMGCVFTTFHNIYQNLSVYGYIYIYKHFRAIGIGMLMYNDLYAYTYTDVYLSVDNVYSIMHITASIIQYMYKIDICVCS